MWQTTITVAAMVLIHANGQRIQCETGSKDFIPSSRDLCAHIHSCRDGSNDRYCRGSNYIGEFEIASKTDGVKIRNPWHMCFCPAKPERRQAMCQSLQSSRVTCNLCEDEATFLQGVNCQTSKNWTDLQLNENVKLLKWLILTGTWNQTLQLFPKPPWAESCPTTLPGFNDCGTACLRAGTPCNNQLIAGCPAGQRLCQTECLEMQEYCSRCADNAWHCAHNSTACLSNSQKCAGACKPGFVDCHGLCQPANWRCKKLEPADDRTMEQKITDFLTSREFIIVVVVVVTVAVLVPIVRHKRKKQKMDYQMGNAKTWVD